MFANSRLNQSSSFVKLTPLATHNSCKCHHQHCSHVQPATASRFYLLSTVSLHRFPSGGRHHQPSIYQPSGKPAALGVRLSRCTRHSPRVLTSVEPHTKHPSRLAPGHSDGSHDLQTAPPTTDNSFVPFVYRHFLILACVHLQRCNMSPTVSDYPAVGCGAGDNDVPITNYETQAETHLKTFQPSGKSTNSPKISLYLILADGVQLYITLTPSGNFMLSPSLRSATFDWNHVLL